MNRPSLPYWLGVDQGCVLVYDAQDQASAGSGQVRVWNSHTKKHETYRADRLRARIVPFFQYMASYEPGLSAAELIQAARVICKLYEKFRTGTQNNGEDNAPKREAIDQKHTSWHVRQNRPRHDPRHDAFDEAQCRIAPTRHAA